MESSNGPTQQDSKGIQVGISPVTTMDDFNRLVPEVMPHIEKALSYTPECSVESTLQRIADGYAVLWVISNSYGKHKGVVVTEIKRYPNFDVAVGHLCGGEDIDEWIHLLSEIEDWAKRQGCRRFEIQGRKGWAKKLPSDYKTDAVVYAKEFLQ